MTPAWNDHVSRAEFLRPELLGAGIVEALTTARKELGIPFRFSLDAHGTVWHPHGDAVPPGDPSHAPKSLHAAGLPGQPFGCAVDFDSYARTRGEAWATFEKLLSLTRPDAQVTGLPLFTGAGVYPGWRTLGYHVDVRPQDHFTLADGALRRVWVWHPKKGYQAANDFRTRAKLYRELL